VSIRGHFIPRRRSEAGPELTVLSLDLILALAALALLGRFWNTGMQARELALRAARRACEDLDQQLLDQTVALARVALARDVRGRWRLQREYAFEFSSQGTERRRGAAIVMRARVERVQLELPDGLVVLPADR
jgi:hypothetical protein